ncbi:hypothetical protein MYCTH_2131210 [Thermothelomyces thermophilus ATCC 42464]|uniref:Ketoreductase (KR) domain-containing protein n=1 Tax=Thermothelomyces thermophilus (strain ATCC 42464 / BCRC 31852 / DSM 1799) TaxID=573729 RepID=G2QNF6_THET4|nr:uncharacterized protein MYCTH_2131210 [Thermothelomyces thermophilus ATCC 42464]AEO62029.1 hypothetical protein MYCTH_2131210 [Thermothelomyces thermophilus ATCC 42464]
MYGGTDLLLIISQRRPGKPGPRPALVGHSGALRRKERMYIVSGANVGLGFEAAKHLARIGVRRVILGVRALVKGRAAKLAIERAAGTASTNNKSNVWTLDLAQPASVRAFARPDVPDRVKNETGMQKHTWEVIAMELEAIEPGCVGKFCSGLD